MRKSIAVAFLVSSGGSFAADNPDNACHIKECFAGDHATTYFKKDDQYYACGSKEGSEYVNFVIGLAAMSLQLTGHLPNISPKTGEPEYLDGPGGPNGTRLMLDNMRRRAHVETFDQAMQQCEIGKHHLAVSIMNSPKDGQSAWVMVDKTKKAFWMPKSHLTKTSK